MNYRYLLLIGAIVLLLGAMIQVETQQIVWKPNELSRLGMAGVGLLLLLGARLGGRAERPSASENAPDA